ncbi:hypothetical protein A6J71_07345 [Enterobacter cancerogenus]|uniref:Uncharacterized protein n=1 Tax=Enterobacter cancerogenus TaxID=69218 RepID=A0AB38P6D3_9ENTR|nr:hypothetical protein A6J71_07345 [Enterobacter cancerogenus]TKK20379.1 hypothetical protein EcCFBP13530_07450 [Enterobacter cancerogenus]
MLWRSRPDRLGLRSFAGWRCAYPAYNMTSVGPDRCAPPGFLLDSDHEYIRTHHRQYPSGQTTAPGA